LQGPNFTSVKKLGTPGAPGKDKHSVIGINKRLEINAVPVKPSTGPFQVIDINSSRRCWLTVSVCDPNVSTNTGCEMLFGDYAFAPVPPFVFWPFAARRDWYQREASAGILDCHFCRVRFEKRTHAAPPPNFSASHASISDSSQTDTRSESFLGAGNSPRLINLYIWVLLIPSFFETSRRRSNL
jgi:hypothetical protein